MLSGSPEENAANARIIAAALDLLAACEARIKFDMKVGREPGVDDGPLPQSRINELAVEQGAITEMMVAAIAMAVGGAA